MNSLTDLIVPRLPHRPYCTDHLNHGLVIRPAIQALEKCHLQLNPSVLRHWLVFDIDFPMAALSWDRANLPPPNWIAVNPLNGHAHCGYLLEIPVVTSAGGRDKPLRYAAAIESAFRIKLRADPGYSGLISKNPLSHTWRTWFLHAHAYSLDELADWVTLAKPQNISIESIGLGRNVTLFDCLRKWSYRMVLTYKEANAAPDLWLRALMREAEVINLNFNSPLSLPEFRAVAKSVAKWVWRRFDSTQFSQIQQQRALKRWSQPRPASTESSKPWEKLGISRRTYYYQKKAGLLLTDNCTDAISDNSGTTLSVDTQSTII